MSYDGTTFSTYRFDPYKQIYSFFDRRLALDREDVYFDGTTFKTLNEIHNKILSSATTKIIDYEGNEVNFHDYILAEFLHHQSRANVRTNLTQLIVGSQILDTTQPYTTSGLDRPANQQNQ
jgi:hypothetical protein